MNAKLRRRLDLLERNTHVNRMTAMEAITAAALSAISDEDLEQLHQFGERGVPFSARTRIRWVTETDLASAVTVTCSRV
jgi:hypothetical protein